MNEPAFIFNEKTGELQRGGKLIALCRLHADIFACLAAAQGPIPMRAIAVATNMPQHAIVREWPAFRRRLGCLHIRVASSRGGGGHGGGYWLLFDEMPTWRPKISAPALIGEGQ